jgi:Protein of unknown function (DUF3341)
MAELYGVLAEFKNPEELVEAARRVRSAGYCDLDSFTPFPVEEMTAILGLRHRNQIGWLGLFGACLGAAIALAMQVFTNWDYPINVGGRPLYPWSAFAVVTFELTVLFGALVPAVGVLVLNGLPRLHYPAFSGSRFHLASRDRFFLCVKAADPHFDQTDTLRFLTALGALSVELVRQ